MDSAEDYFRTVSPTYLENWPPALRRLSIPQVGVRLSISEARALMSRNGELAEGHAPQDISDTSRRVGEAVQQFPGGAFVRLGSRSPKDSWQAMRDRSMRVDAADPLKYLLDSSERVQDDLRMAVANQYEPWIFARQWVEMPGWCEFRCFMKDRKLSGISQYNYFDGPQAEILDDPGLIEWAIDQFFPSFRDASHLDSVVFDVFLQVRKHGKDRSTEVKLLEINPHCIFTDPCLYDWQDGSWGGFRYLAGQTV